MPLCENHSNRNITFTAANIVNVVRVTCISLIFVMSFTRGLLYLNRHPSVPLHAVRRDAGRNSYTVSPTRHIFRHPGNPDLHPLQSNFYAIALRLLLRNPGFPPTDILGTFLNENKAGPHGPVSLWLRLPCALRRSPPTDLNRQITSSPLPCL